jgi:hypothetical protein
MSSLADFQARFIKALTTPNENRFLAKEAGQAGAPFARRMDVYRNNVYSSLIQALRDTYPVVHKLVGEEFFSGTARVYLENNLPTSPCLFEFGNDFPDFLAKFEPAKSLPYLPDVARLEALYLKTYNAADSVAMPREILQALSPEAMEMAVIQLCPTLFLMESRYSVFDIWLAHQSDNIPSKLNVDKPQVGWCHRKGLGVEIEPLSAGNYAMICELSARVPFGIAVERAVAVDPAFDLTAFLTKVVKCGLFVGLSWIDPEGDEDDIKKMGARS